MKTVHLVLLMIATALLLPGTGLAAQANSAAKSAKDEQKAEVHNQAGQARPGEADQNQNPSARRKRNTTKRRPSVNSPKAALRHQVRPDKTTATNLRTHAAGRATGLQQTGSKATTAFPGKAADHRSPPVPPAAVSVNGQHFRNSRNPGARLAVSGGPLTATSGMGAINGSDIKRKP